MKKNCDIFLTYVTGCLIFCMEESKKFGYIFVSLPSQVKTYLFKFQNFVYYICLSRICPEELQPCCVTGSL